MHNADQRRIDRELRGLRRRSGPGGAACGTVGKSEIPAACRVRREGVTSYLTVMPGDAFRNHSRPYDSRLSDCEGRRRGRIPSTTSPSAAIRSMGTPLPGRSRSRASGTTAPKSRRRARSRTRSPGTVARPSLSQRSRSSSRISARFPHASATLTRNPRCPVPFTCRRALLWSPFSRPSSR
jgi:hypothetical protein